MSQKTTLREPHKFVWIVHVYTLTPLHHSIRRVRSFRNHGPLILNGMKTNNTLLVLIAILMFIGIRFLRQMVDTNGDVDTLLQVAQELTTNQKGLIDNQNTLGYQLAEAHLMITDDLGTLRKNNYQIPALETGWYLVTNAFAVPDNTVRWMSYLRKKGHVPRVFFNPDTKWEYVYVYYCDDWDTTYREYQELEKRSYLRDIRIAEINY